MVWGSVSQVLVVDKLPPGLKMYITNIHFDIPEGNNQWWPTFAGISSKSTVRYSQTHFNEQPTC